MRYKLETLEPLSSLEPQCDVQGIKRGRHQGDTTQQTNKQRALIQFVYSCVFTCFRFASTLNMLLCLLLCAFVSSFQSSSMFPRIHFSPVCEFLVIFVIVHTAKTGLLRCCLYTSRRLQQTAVSCKRSICNKITQIRESRSSEVLPKDL